MTQSPFLRHGHTFYVIAEASGNHSQSLDRAHALVQAAADAGAHAVKFQTFTPEEIAADNVRILRGYDRQHDAWIATLGVTTLRELFAQGGLPRPWHHQLKEHATDRGIDFLSTPFSVDAARFLVEEIGVSALKIASGDITFFQLLDYANTLDIPVILSTGAATLDDITAAVLLHLPTQYYAQRLALLHCRSVYPCPASIVNLRSIQYLALNFPYCTPGWSDHTTDIGMPSYALCAGAQVIEKHICLDADGVDAGHSLTPVAFQAMMQRLHEVAEILGTATKNVHPREAHDRLWARRDIDNLRPTAAARAGAWK